MPSKTKLKNAAIAAKSAALPKIPNELLDQFVTGPMTGEAVNAGSMAFKKALIERVMGAELGHHLGYAAGAAKPEPAANQRNGRSAKTVLTGEGPVRIEVPRDRDGSFEPILIPKHERRFTGFDDKIIAMYARGMTMTAREQAALRTTGPGTGVWAGRDITGARCDVFEGMFVETQGDQMKTTMFYSDTATLSRQLGGYPPALMMQPDTKNIM